jgi:Family of unknown function (DUF5372)
MRTAPSADESKRCFTIIHPFHPQRGQRFELIDFRQRWGQWRVYYFTKEGAKAFLPAEWTDAGPKDPFVEQAGGRAIARVEDLLELVKITVRECK